MRQILIPAIVLLAILTGSTRHAKADIGTVNLIANPNFEHGYAAARQETPDPTFEHRILPKFEGKAVLPYGWNVSLSKDEAATLSWVDDAGQKALRVQVPKGESARLGQCFVEVVPGGVYNFGLWVKGSGRVGLGARAAEPGPDEAMVSVGLDAGAEWKQITAQKKVGPHRHLAWLNIEISGPADVTVRGVEVSTQTSSPAPANPLTVKPTQDADTIFFEDFDGPTQAFKLNSDARLTDKDGGRFGRGLVTSSKDGGSSTRLTLGDLPDKGTIEFWFKPSSSNGVGVPLAITTQTPGMSQTQVEFHANVFYGIGKMGFGFRQAWTYERATAENAGWWQPGTWHHIAGEWDGDVMRLYADGVMEAACYGKGRMFLHGKAVDLVLPMDGVIDEIRISKSLRYGPVVPDGAKQVLYSLATTSEPPVAVATKEVKEEELDKERAKLISPVPQSKADYTFGIDQVRPAWEGMGGMTVRKDHFGKGADGIEVQTQRESLGRAMYWRVENIEPGDYYVGVWAETYNPQLRTEYGVDKLLASAYLNGWPVRFATTSDPVQVRPGVWLAELQSGSPMKLKSGDEIAVWPVTYTDKQCFLRLALYRKEPSRGHGITGQTFGVESGNPQRLRLVLSPEIKGSGEDGSKHEARIEIANPLPYAIEAEVTWKLADFYGAPLAGKTEPLHLDPHKTTVISHPFTASGDAHAYQLDVKTRPAPGFKFPVPRPTEMLDLSDYSRWEFRPNLPDPLTVWNHTRKDMADDRTGDRKLFSLDGNDWEWAYLDGRRVPATVPAGLVYARAEVPTSNGCGEKLPPGRFGKWFRKSFVVPAWMKGQGYLLELGQISSEGTIFLNGQRVGYGLGSLPVSLDITKAIKPGVANELVICVRGWIATVKPDFVDRYDPDNYRVAQENEDVYHNDYGCPCLKSVYLRAVPEVRVAQNLVVADAEQGKLRIMTRLENGGTQPRKVTLRFEVFQNGKPMAVPIPEQSVTVANGAVAEVTVDAPAGDLTPWAPHNPVLAKLVTTVLEDGKVLDTFDRRFGYRDLKVEGTMLVLNGKPVRFFGAGCGGSTQDICEAENSIDFFRGEGFDPDIRDEIGVPYLYVIYNCGDKTWPKLNNVKYWDTWRHYLVEMAWNQGSRPGVVGWIISCETMYTIYTSGKEGQEKCYELIYSGAQELRKKIWPYYFCLGSGDGSLGNRLDFYSGHYWNQWENGFAIYNPEATPSVPDGFFLNGAATIPRKGTVLHMTPDWAYGSSAGGGTEDLEFWGMRNGVPNSKYIGDRVAVSAAYQFWDSRGMAWTKMALEGFRDMGLSIDGCVYWHGFYSAANPYVSFLMPQQEIRYYGGAKFDRRLDIFDDEYRPGKLKFQWSLLDPSGKTVRNGEIQAQSDTAFLKRDRVAFDVPQVNERTRFTLNMELSKDGTRWAREERIVDVWPKVESSPKAALKEAVRVFDPKKTLLPYLEKLGCQAQAIASLDAAALAGAKALVVAPDCVTKEMADKRDLVRDFVRDGGRVLILHQEDMSLLPPDVTIEQKAWKSAGFVRAPKHPVMQGLQDRDFQMWNPGQVIVKGAFRTPDKGAFLTLVDSGHDDKTAWAEMLEFYFGQGSMLATQLALTDNFDTDPMAAELLKRMVAYMAQPVFRADSRPSTKPGQADSPLAVLSGASDAVLKRLAEVRTDCATVAGATPDQPVTLIDLSTEKAPDDAAVLRAYVQQGGTLLVHRAAPRHQAWLESLTAGKVSVETQPYQAWVDRQMLDRRDGLVTGLSNLDLYWRTERIHEDAAACWQVSCGVDPGQERGQVQYVVRVDGVADHLFPGGLMEIPVGKGRVIIDQLKWEVSNKDMICGSPNRYLSMLLTNLGVARKLPVPRPTLPKGVTYEPIDLTSVVNRGFKDDKAGDGIGWLDWGPDADLSSFPTGKIDFGGVPYLVPTGDKNAIMLRVGPDMIKCLEKFPDSVAIPVGKSRVAGFYFLHTGGWAGGAMSFGERRIEYADGTKEVIRLNGTNMADWNPGLDSFPDEEVTTTTVAWKGANTQYPVIRVYQTLWVNPHPEKPIKQVVISNAGLEPKQWRVIPHFGLTAAILPLEANLPAVAKDPEKSRTLFAQATALIQEKKPKEAAARLQSALEADDQNTAAWTALTGIRAETDNIDAFTALCRRWAQAMPKNYQPYNVLGKYLENKGKPREAIAEYKKSTEIEPNQPPIWGDIGRLENKLKE